MLYKRINLELIVPAEEADAVVSKLDSALDAMEEHHSLFGGTIEVAEVENAGARRKTALSHVRDAGKTALGAVKTARRKAVSALHLVV